MHVFRSLLVGILVAGIGSHCFGEQKSRLEIAGMSIARKDPVSESGRALSQFGTAGTQLDLYVVLPDETIISIDAKQSKVTLTTPDGRELPLRTQYDGLLSLNVSDEDRSVASVILGSEQLPGRANTSLSLIGSLALVVGRDRKTEEVELKVADGSKLKFGAREATVVLRSDDVDDLSGRVIELSAKEPFASITAIEFLDNSGTLIESQPAGSGFGIVNGDTTYSSAYFVASTETTLKIRLSWFAKTDTVKLPVDLEFGLGL